VQMHYRAPSAVSTHQEDGCAAPSLLERFVRQEILFSPRYNISIVLLSARVFIVVVSLCHHDAR
jgi:hypothetical protein